ncbi:hypothetical protein [Olivibacter sp. XZL3]|uniref:hypothetical protein n=1 Tax=Olivibacter sp. XZL3 TaxID=1735116 RepID=UPI00106545C5|nr:hypothetical protein [Olivibacter sp. XZL3]
MKPYVLVFINAIFFSAANNLRAQSEKSVVGTVVLNQIDTQQRWKVSDVRVENLTAHRTTKPDNLGNFSIRVQIGDSLAFYVEGLPKKCSIVKGYEHLTVYLDSTILLDEVNVSAQLDKTVDLIEVAEKYSKQNSIYFNGKPPITLLSPFDGSPITFLRELISKDGKRVRKFNRIIHQQLEINEVEAKFNTEAIRQVIPTISDEEADRFKLAYKPELEKLRNWSSYELLEYIKQSYELFKKEK